jgi:transposase-like protein
MILATCQHELAKKHGKDRKGNQRWKCATCGCTFTSDQERPLGDMRTDLNDAVRVLSMLLEGMSIRACERITGTKRGCALMISSKPFLRSIAGAEPTVPCSSTMLTSPWPL